MTKLFTFLGFSAMAIRGSPRYDRDAMVKYTSVSLNVALTLSTTADAGAGAGADAASFASCSFDDKISNAVAAALL